MKIKFDASKYVDSHGVQPRGRGSWAFDVPVDSSEHLQKFLRATKPTNISWIEPSPDISVCINISRIEPSPDISVCIKVRIWSRSVTITEAKIAMKELLTQVGSVHSEIRATILP